MKTAIVYYSKHHGNTKKLLDAITAENELTLIDVTAQPETDLSGYDRIGFASGIYYGGYAKQVLAFAQECLPEGKNVFLIYTQGAKKGDFLKTIRQVVEAKKCLGGIAKGHPTEEEIRGAVKFYQELNEAK